MTKAIYTAKDEMLTLAAIAYRGYDLPFSEAVKRPLMCRAMKQCLETLGPVKNKWEIVWGPVSHPDGRLKIDDAAMFVARSQQDPNKLVIVIRGTNPISLTDWISEDFTVTQMAPWPYADNAGKISVSTMYGLGLLQSFHAEQGPPDLTRVTLTSSIADAAKELISKAVGLLHPNAHPAAVIPIIDETRKKEAGGVTLIEFLKAQVAEWKARNAANPLRVYVTGHSKGGTLSTTLALWLADTQGVRADDWSATNQAEITAYSFAGPTAGDKAFAGHSEAALGTRCHRIYSTLDIAPLAWTSEGLAKILTMYPEDPWLKGIIDPVAAKVSPCGYQQIGAGVAITPQRDDSRPVAWQIAYQHLDGYLEALGLLNEMTAGTFLNPLPF